MFFVVTLNQKSGVDMIFSPGYSRQVTPNNPTSDASGYSRETVPSACEKFEWLIIVVDV